MELVQSRLLELQSYRLSQLQQFSETRLTPEEEQEVAGRVHRLLAGSPLLPEDVRRLILQEIRMLKNYPDNMPTSSKEVGELYVLTDNDERIYLREPLNLTTQEYLYRGLYRGGSVIVRWLPQRLGSIESEIAVHNQVRRLGIPTPALEGGFSFWGRPVLVSRMLYPLEIGDNPYLVGAQVLELLRIIHATLGVHNGLRPEIIMKDAEGNCWLTDFASVATQRRHFGFERVFYAPEWSSQVLEPGQVTTPKNDLLELGYLINYLFLVKSQRRVEEGQLRSISSMQPALLEYMELVRSLPEGQNYDYIQLSGVLAGG